MNQIPIHEYRYILCLSKLRLASGLFALRQRVGCTRIFALSTAASYRRITAFTFAAIATANAAVMIKHYYYHHYWYRAAINTVIATVLLRKHYKYHCPYYDHYH